MEKANASTKKAQLPKMTSLIANGPKHQHFLIHKCYCPKSKQLKDTLKATSAKSNTSLKPSQSSQHGKPAWPKGPFACSSQVKLATCLEPLKPGFGF